MKHAPIAINGDYLAMQRGHRQLRKGRRSLPHQVYHVTFATAKRRPTFSELHPARVVINCLRREVEKGHAFSKCFVLMPDHLHWLVQIREAKALGIIINNVKSRSARGVNQALGRTGRVWQKGFYDRAIREQEDLPSIARYIVANPLRAELVKSVRDYPHWDAEWIGDPVDCQDGVPQVRSFNAFPPNRVL